MSVTFRWTPEQFKAAVGQAIDKGLTDTAMVASDIAARQLGMNHGGVPSKPGNPPNTQTGTLRRSHAWELNRPRVARYGVGVKYGIYLERGTRRPQQGIGAFVRNRETGKITGTAGAHFMAPRPWLTIPITRHRARLNQRFTRSAMSVMKARAQ